MRAPLAALSVAAGASLLWFTRHPEDAPLFPSIPRELTLSRSAKTAADEAQALLLAFAPVFIQEQDPSSAKPDTPLPIDFDGDWRATNNWDNLDRVSPSSLRPAAYGAAILTRTHAFLTYVLFYPRDWASPFCVPYICHDNDLEAVQLVVKRASFDAPATLLYVETKAHFDYVAAKASELSRDHTGRPLLRVESQGHGIYPVLCAEKLPEQARKLTPTDYELFSLHTTLWARRDPGASSGELWTSGETGYLAYTGARQGRVGAPLGASMAGRKYAGGVRPPWGLRASVGARGDWFLDPAFVANARHPAIFQEQEFDTGYDFNPFLDDLARECSGETCAPAPPRPPPSLTAQTALGGLLLGLGLVSLRAPRPASATLARFLRRKHAP